MHVLDRVHIQNNYEYIHSRHIKRYVPALCAHGGAVVEVDGDLTVGVVHGLMVQRVGREWILRTLWSTELCKQRGNSDLEVIIVIVDRGKSEADFRVGVVDCPRSVSKVGVGRATQKRSLQYQFRTVLNTGCRWARGTHVQRAEHSQHPQSQCKHDTMPRDFGLTGSSRPNCIIMGGRGMESGMLL